MSVKWLTGTLGNISWLLLPSQKLPQDFSILACQSCRCSTTCSLIVPADFLLLPVLQTGLKHEERLLGWAMQRLATCWLSSYSFSLLPWIWRQKQCAILLAPCHAADQKSGLTLTFTRGATCLAHQTFSWLNFTEWQWDQVHVFQDFAAAADFLGGICLLVCSFWHSCHLETDLAASATSC